MATLLGELGYPRAEASARTTLRNLCRSDNDVVLVADVDGSVVGVGHLHIGWMLHDPACFGRITALGVAGARRRRGIGRALMGSLETAARRAGCVKMEITSGLQRHDAHAFYRAMGYQEKSKRFTKSLE